MTQIQPTSPAKYDSPLALRREGEKYRNIYRVFEEGIVYDVSEKLLNAKKGIDGAVRILDDEYAEIDTHLPVYTHFNMEFCGHRIGSTYGFPRILKQGYFKTTEDEVPPILSFDEMFIGACIQVNEHVPYNTLREHHFNYAMKHIRSFEELKGAILRRYRVSMPGVSEEEILKRGVAITTFRLNNQLILP